MILETLLNLALVLCVISLGISFTGGSISCNDHCLEVAAAAQRAYLELPEKAHAELEKGYCHLD